MTVKIDRGRALENLNMTPLIDVVFLLLIFFLVATTFQEEEDLERAKAERSLDVQLPQASEARPLASRPQELIVTIDQHGQFYEFSQAKGAVSREQLQEILRQAYVNNPGRQTVIIRSDRRTPAEYLVTVMDLCNKAGIRNYVLSTVETPRGGD
jgi:biopolymer transport protein ExbD